MVMYSLNGATPVAALPFRVRYNNRSYTDPAQWFPAIGAAMGWAEVADKPSSDARWSTNDGEWKEKPSYTPATQHEPTWTGQAWSGPTDKTVAERKTYLKEHATTRFRTKRDAGTSVTISSQSVPVSTTHEAAIELDRALAKINRTSPAGTINAVTRSGNPVPLTDAVATTMIEAIEDHVAACQGNEYSLYVAINSATTHAQLDAIDVTAGWP